MSGAASASFSCRNEKEDTIGNKEGASLQLCWSRDNGLLHPVPHCALFLFMPNQQHGTDIEILQNCDTFSRVRKKGFFFSSSLPSLFFHGINRGFLILAKGMNWFIVFILRVSSRGDPLSLSTQRGARKDEPSPSSISIRQ